MQNITYLAYANITNNWLTFPGMPINRNKTEM